MKPLQPDPDLVAGWIAFQHAARAGRQNEADFSPVEKVMELTDFRPEEAWAFVLAAFEADATDYIRGMLAAGPLEDLLANYGAQVIDRIEEQAAMSTEFADLLGGVWRNAIEDDVWYRVLMARNRRAQ